MNQKAKNSFEQKIDTIWKEYKQRFENIPLKLVILYTIYSNLNEEQQEEQATNFNALLEILIHE